MPRIACFLIEPIEKVARILRVDTMVKCPASPYDGYHTSRTYFDVVVAPVIYSNAADVGAEDLDDMLKADPSRPWPQFCEHCYMPLAEIGESYRYVDRFRIWRNAETGTNYEAPHKAPAGAMYRATWLTEHCTSQDDGAPLIVNTPGGAWLVDDQASNCTMPDDRRQERHHCWVRHGVPPLITVDKAGVTCGAGAGSIQCGNYHGFLQQGYLVD